MLTVVELAAAVDEEGGEEGRSLLLPEALSLCCPPETLRLAGSNIPPSACCC
jgi:hypothetical protein